MFNISTKGDYGLLLLSTLAAAMKKGRKFTALREVADTKHMPLKYLAEIALELKKAGIVTSKEGRDGGYSLVQDAEHIKLLDVLEALEGKIEPVKCCSKVKTCACESACSMKSTWREASTMMREFLKNKTLADTLN